MKYIMSSGGVGRVNTQLWQFGTSCPIWLHQQTVRLAGSKTSAATTKMCRTQFGGNTSTPQSSLICQASKNDHHVQLLVVHPDLTKSWVSGTPRNRTGYISSPSWRLLRQKLGSNDL